MSLEETIAQQVEAAVRRAVEPLARELALLRTSREGELVTTAEAARRLGVTPRAVQRWVKGGQLQVVLLGGTRYVRLPAGTPPG